ncbi:MAG TPA: PAS domain S-box protein [Rubrobacter sp.]|nr:PAS domain S-box protein [Rubrobacter sp.]
MDTDNPGRAREAHPHSEGWSHALAENALDVVMVTGPDGTIRYLSPSVERVLGYAPEEVVGTSTAEYVHPDDVQRARGELEALLSKPGVHPAAVETRVRHKDGSWRHLEGMATNLLDDPAVEGLVFNQRDVTDRVRAEEEVKRLNRELEGRVAERTARLGAALSELGESERRFRATFEQAAVGVAHVGTDGRWLRVNDKLCEITGYSREELSGMTFQDITHPDDLGADLDQLRRLLAGEIETYSMEKRYFSKDGSVVWINLTVSLVRGASGEPAYLIAVIEDVSRRRRAEGALRASETRFRTVIEQSPLSTQILSPEGRTLRVNRAFTELWGLTLEDLADYNMLEDPQLVERGIMPHIRKGFAGEAAAIPAIAYDPEETLPGRSGNEEPGRWVRGFVYPVKDESGDVREVVLVHEDVTERKRADESLRESEERYRAVVEQAAEGLYLLDARTRRVIETNPSLQRMLGYSAEELEGMELYDLIELPREEVDETLRRTLERGYRPVGERKYRCKDGGLVDVEIGASVIRYGGGEVVCAVVRDVTERKRAEGALREVREAERRRLARDLHDGALQDLTYALAEAQIVQALNDNPELNGRITDEIEALRSTERRLRAAVYDLRLGGEGGRPLVELLEALVNEGRRMSPGCEVRLDVESRLPEAPPGEGGVEVLRVLREALTNARRHSGAGKVVVTVRVEGEEFVAEVSDDGRGFVPGGPTGVGLNSMRERAVALGGSLKVDSEPGAGTRVRLRVPLRRLGAAEHD